MKMKLAILGIVLVCLSQTLGSGQKSYNDECNEMDIISPFSKDAQLCDSDRGYTCIKGKCKCNPLTSVWEPGPLGLLGINVLGKCSLAVGRPCLGKSNVCASNSACSGDGILTICVCNMGYSAKLDGTCTSFGSRIKNGFGILIISLIVPLLFSN